MISRVWKNCGRLACAGSFAAVLLAAAGTTAAVANALGATAKASGAGKAAVSVCGSISGLTFSFSESGSNVSAVTIGSIPSQCASGNATLYVALRSGSTVAYDNHSAGASIPANATSVTINNVNVAASSFTTEDVVILGA